MVGKKIKWIALFFCLLLIGAGGFFYSLITQGQSGLKARFEKSQCERVALLDKDKNQLVIGAEDLDVDYEREELFISAYDRRKVEKLSKKSKNEIPTGGIYVLPLKTLMAYEGEPITLQSIIPGDKVVGGLRPHGIHYTDENNQILFINRGFYYEQEINKTSKSKKYIMVPTLERVDINGALLSGSGDQISCNANDVLTSNDMVLTSFDHRGCQWKAGLEDVLGQKKSGLFNEVLKRVEFNKAGFANGVVADLSGDVLLAATRERKIHIFSPKINNTVLDDAIEPYSISYQRSLSLPGGPDNLTRAYDGSIIAAVHPSLIRMGLHRKLDIGKAPSRVVRFDPDNDRIDILFDDPKGDLFTAATVGIETKNALILGSVTDEGLLLCRK